MINYLSGGGAEPADAANTLLPEDMKMHYKNGREAKNGDKVVLIPEYAGSAPTIGILYNATAGNDYCNGKIAPISPSDPSPNLKECLHLDDVLASLPAVVPDVSAVVAA